MHRTPYRNLDRDGPRAAAVPHPLRLWASFMAALATTSPLLRASQPVGGAAPASVRGNFEIHGTTAAHGRNILDRAEAVRRDASWRLLHDAEPAPWRIPCEIHVHSSADSFAAALGRPPSTARGATSLEFAADRVTLRRIDVMDDGPAVVPGGLAHEIVHVVLADRFIEAPPPRWADEGLALLYDPPDMQRRHDADFRAALRLGRAWRAADLLALEDYPADESQQRVFYGQSAALVRRLVARRGAAAFVSFAADCRRLGTAAALAKHYEIDSITEVDRGWNDEASIESFSAHVAAGAAAGQP